MPAKKDKKQTHCHTQIHTFDPNPRHRGKHVQQCLRWWFSIHPYHPFPCGEVYAPKAFTPFWGLGEVRVRSVTGFSGSGRVVPGIQEGNSLNTLSGRLAPFCHFCEMWDDTGGKAWVGWGRSFACCGRRFLTRTSLTQCWKGDGLQLGYVGCLLNHFGMGFEHFSHFRVLQFLSNCRTLQVTLPVNQHSSILEC